jgi:uncharacterized membrane protein YphA (DoxX/SURF4 family)
MKTVKITYWITTGLIALLYAFDAFMFLSANPMMVASMQSLGYPAYLLTMLGVAKLLAVVGLLLPRFPRLREWTYAGLYINMIGAIWSHAAMGQMDKLAPVSVILVIVTVSYITYRKLQPATLPA